MGAKTSAEMMKAVRLHKGGLSVPEAARKAGVWEGSLYAKLRQIKEAENTVVTDSSETEKPLINNDEQEIKS